MKVIISELYIKNLNWKQVESRWENFNNEFKNFINGNVSIYDGLYQDEEVIGIDLEIEAPTFKECEANFIISMKLILKHFNQIPKIISKIRLVNFRK